MAKIVFRQEAIDELNDIWIYAFEECSEKQADKYYGTLEFACKQIGLNPELGKEYKGINSTLFGLRTGKHVIFYQVINEQEIEIIRILHERMDLKDRLKE
ncbi:MAG: type II toxin-antitoxin system RelE/ParE family toxin [Paludibacteraceae bacterium]